MASSLLREEFDRSETDKRRESEAVEPLPDEVVEPTAIARRLDQLKSSAVRAVEKRERLAQPFFWSLFHSEISEIRKRKERERLLRQILLGP